MLKQARRAARLLQVGDLVIKHGLGSVLDFVGVTPRMFHRTPSEDPEERALPLPHRVRLLLQDLGPTFVKLGQLASTRSDLLSEEFLKELRKLQDQVEPVPFSEVSIVLQEELGRPVEAIFASFEPVPVASASIGQVHRARTLDGRDVVVKVQRPGVAEVIRNDMAILNWAARRLEVRLDLARKMNLSGLLEEFEDLLLDELVYTIEGHNADRMRQNLASNPMIRIPAVVWDLTTRRLLTLEDVSGIKLMDRVAMDAAGLNAHDLAVALGQAYIKQILVDGFFHGDPHPGNFFVGTDGRISLVDFGIMGRLDEKTRDTLVSIFIAVFHQDTEEAVEHLISLGAVSPDTDMIGLTRDVDRILSKYYFMPRQEIHIGEAISHVLAVVHRHDVNMPTELALLAKVLLTIEGLCLQLDPAFDLNTAVKPFANELIERSLSPRRLLGEFGRNARELSRVARLVPGQMVDLLNKAERGRFRLIVQYDHSDRSLDHLYEIGNRMAMSIGLSAMVLGSVLLFHTSIPPIVAYVAFGFSFLMMARLMLTMLWGLPLHRRIHPRRPR